MNMERFVAIIDHIRTDPDSWDQIDYHSDCGTAHCIAGHAQLRAMGSANASKFTIPYDSKAVYHAAKAWLEIGDTESLWLFHYARSMEDFERVIRQGLALQVVNDLLSRSCLADQDRAYVNTYFIEKEST